MKKSSLNHNFRTIWSEVLNAWVAVSELASAKGKRSGSSTLKKALNITAIYASGSAECNDRFRIRPLALAVILCFGAQAQANPIGAQVVNGTAAISQAGNTLTVTNSPNAIINWQGFSINPNETTRFIQQSAASSVLNRVVGSDPSQLLGALTSNGRVFLINPAGILVGQGARIDVAGFVASTLNLTDADFLAGKLNFGPTLNAGGIQNAGSITTPEGGTVYLVAPQVENAGLITTPKGETILAAGNTVQLIDTGTPGVTVQVAGTGNATTNLGQILADSGRIGMVAAVIKNSGTISASSLVSQGGKIFLKASQRAEAGGTVSASGTTGGTVHVLANEVGIMDGATVSADGVQGGGTILVGGDYQGKNPAIPNAQVSYVAPTATINANAVEQGNGGKVIVWADDTARVYGSISARGGSSGGNGGFVETSGYRYLDVTRAPDLTAPSGRGGSWLLDPEDITISSAGGSNITATSPFSPAAAGSSILSDAVLRAALVLGGTVTVDTTGGAGTTGSILVDGTASLTNIDLAAGAATLYLKAHNDITVNSSITAVNNPLTMFLIADQDGNFTGAAYINKALNSNNGSINISAFGDIALNDGSTAKLTAGTGTVTLTSVGGAIVGNMTGVPLDVSAASVQLNAASGISAGPGPFYVNAGTVGFNNTGSQLVRIYNSRAGASSLTGITGGPLAFHSSDSANPTSVGNLTVGGDIKFQINNLNINNPISAGANTVYLSPFTLGNPVSIHGGAIFDLSSAEISIITAGKIVVGYDGYNYIYPSEVQLGTGSAVNITNAANLEIWGNTINTGPTAFSNAGGSVGLFGDAMTLGGSISSGKVWLRGASSNQNIDLGGADTAGTLGLTSAELGQITATTLFIGDPLGSGNLHVSSAISPAVTTLGLGAGGSITQGASGNITAAYLAINAGGNVILDTAPSVVTNLAAQVSGSASNFSFKNAAALNIDANIDGLSGISMPGFVNPGGMIFLTSTGALTQSAGALLAGSAVYAEGSKVLLTQANSTGVIAGKATGSATGDIFSYASSNGIMVTTVNGFSGIQTASPPDAVSVVLNAGSAGISQNAPIFAGASTHGISLNTAGSSMINSNMYASTINLQSSGGITLGTGANLAASGAGNAIIMNAGTGGFTNSAAIGAAALNNTGGGRWLVYAASPASVTKGGLTSAFRHYNAVYANYAAPTETGNGFIYTSVPGVLSVNTTLLTGVASNTYGATPTASFGYAFANPAIADNEDLALVAGAPTFTPAISSVTPAGNYTINYSSGLASAAGYTFVLGAGLAYTVDPATLSIVASLTGTTSKIYDGTTAAVLTPGNFLLSGFVGTDSATVTQTVGTYASKNAGNNISVSTTLISSNFSSVGSTNLANYILPSTAIGNIGNITPATISAVTGILANNKVYDATTAATLNTAGAAFAGMIAGDVLTVGTATGAFADPLVGTLKPVAITGITLAGVDMGNYLLGSTIAAATAGITAAPMQVAAPVAPVIQQAVATATTTAITAATATTVATDPMAATAPVAVDTGAITGATMTATTGSTLVTLAGPVGGSIGGTAGTFGGDSVVVTTEPMPAMVTADEVAAPALTTEFAAAGTSDSGSGSAAQKDDGAKQDSAAKKEDAAKKDDPEKKDGAGKQGGKDEKDNKDKPSAKPEKC